MTRQFKTSTALRLLALGLPSMLAGAPVIAQSPEAAAQTPAASTASPTTSAVQPAVPTAPDPKAQDVLKQARAAIGGDAALAKIQSATVTGSARRTFGEREMTADVTLDFLFPD